jgi:NAD(P)-dependent dehydrogenase (short-subunit alcohol dehydrogenase family)
MGWLWLVLSSALGGRMANSYDLCGKCALITGGAKGIGRAIVKRFVASGAIVCVWDQLEVRVEGVQSEVVDITQPDEIAEALERTLTGKRVDILVNDAGYLGVANPFETHERTDWQRIVAINLLGTIQVTHAVLPRMIRAGGGRIINLGSVAGKEGLPGLAVYSAASGGVIAFTKALSREVVDRNVLVNCIAPGPIDTDMIRGLGPAVVEKMIADSPMKRLGTPDEVAELAAWLASDAGRLNSGAVFDMSGGRAKY